MLGKGFFGPGDRGWYWGWGFGLVGYHVSPFCALGTAKTKARYIPDTVFVVIVVAVEGLLLIGSPALLGV